MLPPDPLAQEPVAARRKKAGIHLRALEADSLPLTEGRCRDEAFEHSLSAAWRARIQFCYTTCSPMP